jgi:hypothetical protein
MNDEFIQNKKMKEIMRSSLLRQKNKNERFCAFVTAPRTGQDAFLSHRRRLQVACPARMNWTGNSLRSDR